MPDQRLPLPAELPTPAPAQQTNGQAESGPGSTPEIIPADNQDNSPVFSTPDSPIAHPPAPSSQDQDQAPQRIPYWLQQAEKFLRVIVRMYLGLLVCCAPWYPPAWDNNPLFASSPWLLSIVTQGAVRGLISGLGILNLWIAVREALRSSSDSDTR